MPTIKKHRETTPAGEICCPRCGQSFSCNAANIEQCQCFGVGLGQAEFAYLREHGYSPQQTGCLCRNCLLEIQGLVKSSSS